MMEVKLSTSDLISVGSTFVTIASIGWAIYERVRSTTARGEVKKFRRLLLRQQISQKFSEVPERARILFEHLRASEWEKAANAALQVTADLASLNGIQSDLIGTSNRDKIEAALEVMREVNQKIPRTGATVSPETAQFLVESCTFVLLSVYAIESALRFTAALGGDDDGK